MGRRPDDERGTAVHVAAHFVHLVRPREHDRHAGFVVQVAHRLQRIRRQPMRLVYEHAPANVVESLRDPTRLHSRTAQSVRPTAARLKPIQREHP
jgi:hypothetical protein